MRLTWMDAYLRLFDYVFAHEDSSVPQDYRNEDGFRLGRWVHNQRTAYRARKQGSRAPSGTVPLCDRYVQLLEQVPGWQWHSKQRGRPKVRDWRELVVRSSRHVSPQRLPTGSKRSGGTATGRPRVIVLSDADEASAGSRGSTKSLLRKVLAGRSG